MKRRMDWIDWTLLAVLTAIETESLGWPVLLIAAGMAILLYVQQRRLQFVTETELMRAFDHAWAIDESGRTTMPVMLDTRDARGLLEAIAMNGFALIKVGRRRWRWRWIPNVGFTAWRSAPEPETGSSFMDDVVRLDRAKFLKGPSNG